MEKEYKMLSNILEKHINNCNCLNPHIIVELKADTSIDEIKKTQPNICSELSDIINKNIDYYKRLRQFKKDYFEKLILSLKIG